MGTTEAGTSSGVEIETGMLTDGGGANGSSSIGDVGDTARDAGWHDDAFGGYVGGEGDEYIDWSISDVSYRYSGWSCVLSLNEWLLGWAAAAATAAAPVPEVATPETPNMPSTRACDPRGLLLARSSSSLPHLSLIRKPLHLMLLHRSPLQILHGF